MNNEFDLKNPPIKEVALGLFIDNPKYDIEYIKEFKKNVLSEEYPNELPIRAIDIKINKGVDSQIEVISNNDLSAFSLTNENKNEIWSLDLKRILFSDKTKYTSFNDFLNKFSNKVYKIYTELNETITNLIVLRYSNEFSFKISELSENFAILPFFEQKYNDVLYASNESYMNVINIVSSTNDKISATINTKFVVDEIDSSKLLINFDIEIKYQINNKINLEQIYAYLIEMREFKNKIFFSNVIKAQEVFK